MKRMRKPFFTNRSLFNIAFRNQYMKGIDLIVLAEVLGLEFLKPIDRGTQFDCAG